MSLESLSELAAVAEDLVRGTSELVLQEETGWHAHIAAVAVLQFELASQGEHVIDVLFVHCHAVAGDHEAAVYGNLHRMQHFRADIGLIGTVDRLYARSVFGKKQGNLRIVLLLFQVSDTSYGVQDAVELVRSERKTV